MLTAELSKAKSLVLIDVNNTLWRAYFTHKDITFKVVRMNPVEFGVLRMLSSAIRILPWPCLLVFASDRGSGQRKFLFPDYKANRRKLVTASVIEEMSEIAERVRSGLPSITVFREETEADDLIFSFYHYVFSTKGRLPTVIISTDRDLFYMLGFEGILILTKANSIKTRLDVCNEFGIESPLYIPLYKAVLGDSSDNIKPIRPRLRKKEVVDLINRTQGRLLFFLDAARSLLSFSDWECHEVARRYWLLFRLQRVDFEIEITTVFKAKYQDVLEYQPKSTVKLKKEVVKKVSVW